MIAFAAGVVWAGCILVAGAGAARAARVRALIAGAASGTACPVSPRVTLLERVGVALHRVARRRSPPPSTPTARRLGAVVVAVALVAPVAPVAVPAIAAMAWALPVVRARRAERRRREAVPDDLPDVVDLLVLAVEAGLNVSLAVAAVARRGRGPLAAELGRVVQEAAVGRRLSDALDDLTARAGEVTRPLVAALLASERYGAPLSAGLARLADDVRRQRRRRAEEIARRVPVKLLFPLVTCTLPAFALLTVAPLVAGALRSLRL